jgi:DNA-binding NarL/FixJ family response regulator
MILEKLNSSNVKLTITESENTMSGESCYIELIINIDLIKDFIQNIIFLKSGTVPSENPLTAREQQILKYIASGKSKEEIALKAEISIHTIKAHLHNIYNKLSVQDRTQAVVKAIKNSWINI